jgi:hypothetical protein
MSFENASKSISASMGKQSDTSLCRGSETEYAAAEITGIEFRV